MNKRNDKSLSKGAFVSVQDKRQYHIKEMENGIEKGNDGKKYRTEKSKPH